MRIQRLELFGFKSFPDRTSFEFGSGISGVVGPNGSGKSNVVDALRWVIGEQSARSLRGKDMADVIFAGSAARSPVGFAEVALTLSSAEGEPFPGDLARFEEVEVGRRLYRDGTSEYLLNRVKCRRRDIVDLFMDTGVGSNLYSFIAQGQVDRIVSQSPQERRSLIDEAAGISRYKVRRDEALTRLAATATQLDRASDVADEMGRRLRSLEKQVISAGRFRRVRAALRQREIALGVVKYAALSGDRRALRERLRTVQQDTGALRRSVDRVEVELNTRQAEVDSVAEAVSTWRDQAAELEAQRREAEGAKILHQKRHEELLQGRQRALVRSKEVAQHASTSRAEAAALEDRLREVADRLASVGEDPKAVEEAEGALATASARVARLSELAAAQEAERASLQEQLDDVRGVQAPEPWVDATVDRSALATLNARRAAAEAQRVEARRALEAVRSEVSGQRRAIEQARQAHRAALNAWEQHRRGRERAERDRQQWLSRTGVELERHRRSQRDRVRALVEERAAEWTRAVREHAQRQERALRERAMRIRDARQGDWGVDFGASDSSLEASRTAEEESTTAERAADHAREQRAACQGRVAALQAEFEALERQRQEGLPEAWIQRSTLDASVESDDPVRVGRPELLGLPVLAPADLEAPRGRGVLPVQRRWMVVDTVADLVAHLQHHGPPVVTRDGRVRVDADGLAEIGVAPARWGAVKEELMLARQELLDAGVASERAEGRRLDARQAVENAREAVRLAEASVADALQQALTARQQALEHQQELWLEQASEGLRAARSALVEPWGGEGLLAAAWLRRRPPPLQSRPAWVEPELDASRVVASEVALDSCRQGLGELVEQIDAERHRLGEIERRVAVDRARFEAEQRAATHAQLRVATLERRLADLQPIEGRDEARASLVRARELHRRAVHELETQRRAAVELRELRARLAAEREALEKAAQRAELDAGAVKQEARTAAEQAEQALASMEASREAASIHAVQRGEVLERLERDRARLQKLRDQAKLLRDTLTDHRDRFTRGELEEKELAQRVEQLQLDIESLRKSLGDRYQVSLPGLLDRLQLRRALVLEPEGAAARELEVGDVRLEAVEPLEFGVRLLDDEDRVVAMVEEVETLRTALARIGDVNLAAEEEYRDLFVRAADLDTQRKDLEESVTSIRSAIAKMNRTCRTRFRDAYDRVNEAFQLSYPKLVGGGDARLALTDDEDLLETGVDIFVRPPGKRLQNLTLLSGGEKAMTAIALLLALFKVRPSPFCVLDEVDAPLDEANGARFNEMVREMSTQSQFIVITHNRKTMECADVLYGVTMADPGVSKLVSVALS